MLGANVPVFLKRLKRRRSRPKVILAAADALGALGATRMLKEMGLTTSLITGPCTDTHALRRRTEDLCRIPALNMTSLRAAELIARTSIALGWRNAIWRR